MEDTQDIPDRRVYVVRPGEALLEKLKVVEDHDLVTQLCKPWVVMTEELPFEKFLEGWRSKILELCKSEFLKKNFDFDEEYILYLPEEILPLLPDIEYTKEFFDTWWIAEEADYIQIPTNWTKT